MSAELVGQTLNGLYSLVRQIASGGMGAVFEGTRVDQPGVRYAIKVLHAAPGSVALQRFQREAVITRELENEHIVAVHDFRVTETGMPYLVMEYLEGEDLAARIREKSPLPLVKVVEIVGQIALGLDAAHRAGIVHRDLKPQNIFLLRRFDDQEFVKLLDFGVSKFRDSAQVITRDNTIPGTPNYMSPEQAEGHVADVDERSDVFALGAVIWEMLTGRRAFEAPTVSGALYQVVHGEPLPLHRLRPDLPLTVHAVLRAAMAKQKKARYPSVTMLAAALAKAAIGAPAVPSPSSVEAAGSGDATVELSVPLVVAKPRKILFVDDSPSMRALVSTWLTRAGYEVSTASDGVEGGEKVVADHPHLVVTDVSMPRCDGFSLCRTIKDDPLTNDIPVILFTRLDEATDIVNGLAAGVDAFVVKGSSPEALLRQVDHVLAADSHPSRRKSSAIEKLQGRLETLGRLAIFKSLFDACFREVPFDVLAVLINRPDKRPLLLLGSHYDLSPEHAELLTGKIAAEYSGMRNATVAAADLDTQVIVVDETAMWKDIGVELKRSVVVPMFDGQEVIGCLGVLSFEDQPDLAANTRFFFEIGVAAARAMRRND